MRIIDYLHEFLGVIPDSLGNLRFLSSIAIYNSPITNITEQLGFLRNLNGLYLRYCNLTTLPDFSGISFLSYVDFQGNQLSKVNGLAGVRSLNLEHNLFTDIPTLKNSDNLRSLYMSHNPIKNMVAITSYTSLQTLYLHNTNISSIPHTIDKLQQLEYLGLSDNKLFFLPTNILNLPKLKSLNIQNNLFLETDKQTYKNRFNQSNPDVTLYI